MTYTAADVANNGGVAWVRSIAARMDPSGIESQIQGYAAAQTVLQNAAASTTKGQNTLTHSWNGQAADAAQQQFTTTANLHTETAETIQQVMIGLSYSSSGMNGFIQTVLGPSHQPGQSPDPTQGIPLEEPVPLITDQQTSLQAHQKAATQNLQVRQQAANALNELASSYSTAQTYFNGVSQAQIDSGPQVKPAAFNLGPDSANSPQRPSSVRVAAVHSRGSAGSSAPFSAGRSGGLIFGSNSPTALQGGAPPITPVAPTNPITGGNPPGATIPSGETDSRGSRGKVPGPEDGRFNSGAVFGSGGRGVGSGSEEPGVPEASGPFDGALGFGHAGVGSSASSTAPSPSGVFAEDGGPGGGSRNLPMMMSGMGQGLGRARENDGSEGRESSRRSARILHGQFFDTDEQVWELPRPSSAYEGAVDQYGRPIEAYKTGWQRIKDAAQKAKYESPELEGPW